jgi:lysosomal acid lipase/cholesteryl ester hydrolase
MLKNIIMSSLNLTISSINFLQDQLSSNLPETYEDIKIHEELREEKWTSEELILNRGYPMEIHYVETEDGYVLKLFRIPASKYETNYKHKQKEAILLIHGIFDSSDGWLCNSEDKCIPLTLVKLGYDVWLGNSRGNKHSRHHKRYSSEDKEFWNFSFHEMGLYDIPAIINHIKEINKYNDKIIYIGHSQGTAQLFSALTLNLDYFHKNIKLFVALGPVASVHNMTSKILLAMEKFRIDHLFDKLSFDEVLTTDEKIKKASSWIFPKLPIIPSLILNMISDDNCKESNNLEMMPVYLSHNPGGSSLKAINHFVQCLRYKKFIKYDYGTNLNKEIYGVEEPPEYELNMINDVPIALFSGAGDKLSSPKDVLWLKQQLGNNVLIHKEYNLGHSSFLMAKDMSWFNDVIDIMELYK